MNALCLSDGANDTFAKAYGNTTPAKAYENTTLAEASGDDHSDIANNSVPFADTVGVHSVLLSSEQHYKSSNNSLRILAVMCRGIKTDDGGEIVDFDMDLWNSLNRTTYRSSLVEWRSEVW